MGWAARANRKRGPKLNVTISMEVETRRLRVRAPDDLDEAMKMLEGAVHLIAKLRKEKAKAKGNGQAVEKPRILKPTDAEAAAVLRRH